MSNSPFYQRLLLPYDGSESADHAVAEAYKCLDISPTTQLFIINVVPLSNSGYLYGDGVGQQAGNAYQISDSMKVLQENIEERNGSDLQRMCEDKLAPFLDRISCKVLFGATVADTIIDYISEEEIDLVIMGCRGLGAIRGMLGSVSYAVLRKADCPVFIIK